MEAPLDIFFFFGGGGEHWGFFLFKNHAPLIAFIIEF